MDGIDRSGTRSRLAGEPRRPGRFPESSKPPPVSLRAALQAFDRGDMAAAETAVLATLNDPSFAALGETSRHLALALATQVMLQTKKPVKAQQYAIQATQLPQQTVDDWRNRLRAAFGLQDLRDEAQCVTAIFREWGADISVLPAETIASVANNTDLPELSDVRLEMLETLYQRRWHPADGGTASGLWLELLEMQRYFEPLRPPRAAQWHGLSAALRERATIRAAVAKVGRIDSYPWRYDTYD